MPTKGAYDQRQERQPEVSIPSSNIQQQKDDNKEPEIPTLRLYDHISKKKRCQTKWWSYWCTWLSNKEANWSIYLMLTTFLKSISNVLSMYLWKSNDGFVRQWVWHGEDIYIYIYIRFGKIKYIICWNMLEKESKARPWWTLVAELYILIWWQNHKTAWRMISARTIHVG